MARIDEEQILVRFSKLIRDGDDPLAKDILTQSFRADVEAFVQTLVPTDVLVEANIVVGAESGIPYEEGAEPILFSLSSTGSSVVEGSALTIEITAVSSVGANTTVPYTITGVSAAKIGASLTGTFTVSGGGSNSVTFNTVDSNGADGNQALTLTLDDYPSTSITVTIASSV